MRDENITAVLASEKFESMNIGPKNKLVCTYGLKDMLGSIVPDRMLCENTRIPVTEEVLFHPLVAHPKFVSEYNF